MLLANAVHTQLLREQSPMPITRRRRANPPDQPENNDNHLAEQTENAGASLASERDSAASAVAGEAADTGVPNTDQTVTSFMPPVPPTAVNGAAHQRSTRPLEGGRRTSRAALSR